MKKLSFLLFVIFSLAILSSCKDDEVKPGIIYTDNPPKDLFFQEYNYANSYRGWINQTDILQIRKRGNGCTYYSDENGKQYSNECGEWELIQVRKYWGIINGVVYLSQSKEWYTLSSEVFVQIKEQVEKRGTLIVYLGNGDTPWDVSQRIIGFDQ